MKSRYSHRLPWLLGLIVLAASAAGAGWMVHSRAGQEPPSRPTPAETLASVQPGERFVVGFGHVDVDPGVTSLSPTQPGRVAEVLVKENQTVKAGAELLRLDDEIARLRVREAEADLAAAEKRLAEARKLPEQHQRKVRMQQAAVAAAGFRLEAARIARDRKEELSKTNLVNAAEARAAAELVKELEAGERVEQEKLRELESIDPSVGVAQAEEDGKAKQSRLEQARYALRECTLRAPKDGTVLRVLAGPGDLLTAQSKLPAVLFCPAGPRIIRAEIEQEYAGRVAVGQRARIEDDSRAGGTWEGKVVHVSDWFTQRRSVLLDPLQFNDVRTLECIVELAPGVKPPRIGQRVRVILGQSPGE
jgi:multidrug resistance efflux pump